jgi:hypothetical protein
MAIEGKNSSVVCDRKKIAVSYFFERPARYSPIPPTVPAQAAISRDGKLKENIYSMVQLRQISFQQVVGAVSHSRH